MTWVAVDGGQSALRLRWPGGEGKGPGYRYGPDPVQPTLDGLRHAAADAGLAGPVDVACLGLTGYPARARDVARLGEAVAGFLGAREVRLCADMVTAHAGALPEGHGVVLAAGTGVVCLALNADGQWHKVDGAGYLFGDDGSAFAIGRAAIAAAQRARDGRGPVTALAEVAPDPAGLYGSPSIVDDVAQFVPQVFACAAAGDPVAAGIVAGAAAELARTVTAAAGAIRLDPPIPVAYTGGVFAAGAALLDPLRAGLPDHMALRPAGGTPLDGATRLATGPPGHYAGLMTILGRTRILEEP